MRVLFFSRTYTTHDRRFLEALAGAGYDAYFLPLEGDGNFDARPLPAGVRGVTWPRGVRPSRTADDLLALMGDFGQILDTIDPDLVHAGPMPSCAFVAALAARHPFVAMSWGSDVLVDADRDPRVRWITAYVLRHADGFVCDCDAVRDTARQLYPVRDDRIAQFPWGVDLRTFAPGRSASWLHAAAGWPPDAMVALSTRTLEPGYGHDVLLEAFSRVATCEPRARLVMLGSGSISDDVDTFIREHHLEHAVYRPGRIGYDELPRYMRAADLYVSATPSDGTSISLLEAMATALPVIVIDAPGNREWVRPGVNGWLSAFSADAFEAAWRRATAMSAEQAASIGAANRAVAERRADWDVNVRQLFALYDRLLPGGAAST